LGQVRTEVVGKAVDRRVDIALRRGDDAIVIPRYPLHLGGVGIEQPLLKVSHIRLKRSRSLVDVEIDFIGEAARDTALAKLALRIDVAVELVRIAG
jgi:hypothetical protein